MSLRETISTLLHQPSSFAARGSLQDADCRAEGVWPDSHIRGMHDWCHRMLHNAHRTLGIQSRRGRRGGNAGTEHQHCSLAGLGGRGGIQIWRRWKRGIRSPAAGRQNPIARYSYRPDIMGTTVQIQIVSETRTPKNGLRQQERSDRFRNAVEESYSFPPLVSKSILPAHLWQLVKLCLLCGVGAATMTNAFVDASRALGATPADSFKAFVSAPPALADLTWTEEMLSPPNGTSFFRMKLQPGALFLGEASNPLPPIAPTDSYGIVVSRFARKYWVKEFNALYVWTDRDNPRERGNSADALFALKTQTDAARILNMGFQQAPIGSILWRDDRFTVTNFQDRAVFNAHLEIGENGYPAALVIERRALKKSPSSVPDSVVTYKYSCTIGPCFSHFCPARSRPTRRRQADLSQDPPIVGVS